MTDDTLKAMEAFLAEEFRAVAEKIRPADRFCSSPGAGTPDYEKFMDLALRITEQYVKVHKALNPP